VSSTGIAAGVALSVLSAASLGSADFAGGLAARTRSALAVVAVMQAIEFVGVVVVILIIAPPHPSTTTVVSGLIAGAVVALGLTALYRGLAMGSMAVVAALSTVGSVAIPFAFSAIVLGTFPHAVQLVGVVITLAASVMMAGLSGRVVSRTALLYGLIAAVSFGTYFILLSRGASSGLWVLLTSRGAAVVLLVVVGSATRLIRVDRGVLPLAVTAGVLELLGSGLVIAALRYLPLGLIVPITGTYPVATALLAWAFLGERLRLLAYLSVALALIGIVLIGQG
jgi:drug/metabolite transporter (DMT)-like permease